MRPLIPPIDLIHPVLSTNEVLAHDTESAYAAAETTPLSTTHAASQTSETTPLSTTQLQLQIETLVATNARLVSTNAALVERLRDASAKSAKSRREARSLLSSMVVEEDDGFGTGDNVENDKTMLSGFEECAKKPRRPGRHAVYDMDLSRHSSVDGSEHSSPNFVAASPAARVSPASSQHGGSQPPSQHGGSMFAGLKTRRVVDVDHAVVGLSDFEARSAGGAGNLPCGGGDDDEERAAAGEPWNADEPPDDEEARHAAQRMQPVSFIRRGSLTSQAIAQAIVEKAKADDDRASLGKAGRRRWFWVRAMLSSGALAFVGMLALSLCHWLTGESDYSLILGSFGAEAVLLFAAPYSPFSQPRNVIGGHLVACFIGVLCQISMPGNFVLAIPVAVSLTIMAQMATDTIHPPGGGAACIAVLGMERVERLGWAFFAPVFISCVLMLLSAMLNNLFVCCTAKRRYPSGGLRKFWAW